MGSSSSSLKKCNGHSLFGGAQWPWRAICLVYKSLDLLRSWGGGGNFRNVNLHFCVANTEPSKCTLGLQINHHLSSWNTHFSWLLHVGVTHFSILYQSVWVVWENPTANFQLFFACFIEWREDHFCSQLMVYWIVLSKVAQQHNVNWDFVKSGLETVLRLGRTDKLNQWASPVDLVPVWFCTSSPFKLKLFVCSSAKDLRPLWGPF